MDLLFGKSPSDAYIEDYLLKNYKPSDDTDFAKDQQFARPIEDEDLFGDGDDGDADKPADNAAISSLLNGHNSLDSNTSDKASADVLHNRDLNASTPCQIDAAAQSRQPSNAGPSLDDIFLDDYSSSGYKDPDSSNRHKEPAQKPKTPAQIRMIRMKEQLLVQARAMSIKPKKIGAGFNDDGTIEVVLEQERMVSDCRTKFMFNKMFNNSKKALDDEVSPERDKTSWDAYKESLRKKISAHKRKIWDSFQRKDNEIYDEEEEIVEVEEDAEDNSAEGDADDGEEMDEDCQEPDEDKPIDQDEQCDEQVITSNSPQHTAKKRPVIHEDSDSENDFENLEAEDAPDDKSDNSSDKSNDHSNDSFIGSVTVQEKEDHRGTESRSHSAAESSDEHDAIDDDDLDDLINQEDSKGISDIRPQRSEQSNSADDSSDADDDNDDFRLNLDDSDDELENAHKRRKIFIDDEASSD